MNTSSENKYNLQYSSVYHFYQYSAESKREVQIYSPSFFIFNYRTLS